MTFLGYCAILASMMAQTKLMTDLQDLGQELTPLLTRLREGAEEASRSAHATVMLEAADQITKLYSLLTVVAIKQTS